MDPSAPGEAPTDRDPRDAVEIPQYSLLKILAVWAAAALPMAALAWRVAPALEDSFGGEENVPLVKALLICLTAGLIWQFVLVVILVRREQGTLGWPVVREALWLRAPRSPKTGRRGGRLWLILIPPTPLFAAESMIPAAGMPSNRDLAEFIDSDVGKQFLSGAWGWFALIVVLQIFNTVLGEEAALPWVAPAAHEPHLRAWRLVCKRRPVRRLPPTRAVGDPGHLAGHVHHRVSLKALPKLVDRDRRAQRPERVLHHPDLHARRLTGAEPQTVDELAARSFGSPRFRLERGSLDAASSCRADRSEGRRRGRTPRNWMDGLPETQ